MRTSDRRRWRQRLKAVTPIEVTDKYPGNPDYITVEDFEKMVDVLVEAVQEEREQCAGVCGGDCGCYDNIRGRA